MNETQRLRVELAQAKKYLDITDVSLMSNKSISTIRRKISDGLIKAYQDVPNGKLLFKRIDVENWIEGGVSFYDNLSIDELDLSVRSYNVLQYHNIRTIGQVRNFTEENLLKFKNINTKTVSEIKEKLVGFNLSLKA